ncbi:hypothetical protein BJV82DRAFT_616240 [Fennellomyces sp. T-0311]|nr:hypothetical protein BJV82DRAFT_616240 [Fennellomyces sp. T-0311]
MSGYELIHAALNHVAKNSVPGIEIFACASSDPYFGLKNPRHLDRLSVAFKFQGDQVEIQCQILFDSSDYTFVPDIIVDPEWHQLGVPALFPSEWPIHEEDCLRNWLTSIWKIFDHKIFGDELEEEYEEHDELQSSQSSIVPVTAATPTPEPLLTAGDAPDQVRPNVSYDTPILSFSDQEDTMEVEERSPLERRAFIEQWISTMPNHVIRFDAEHYESIALYLTVKIPDSIWREMQVHQQKSLLDLGDLARGKGTVGKPKNSAPAIVQLKMEESFPDTPLSITIISAVNTNQDNKNEPEHMQFEMGMNPRWTLEDMCRKVQESLVEEIPKFHSGLYPEDSA